MRILITGAASGIGRAVGQAFARDAAMRGEERPSLLLADLDGARVAEAAEFLGAGAAVGTAVADLSDPDIPGRLVAQMVEQFGGVDAVVSNAGALYSGPLTTLDVSDYDRLFAVNTRATWLLGKAAHPHMKDRGGAIVATASMSATAPTPNLGAYSPSKAALVMLIRQMALEWGPSGIRCNCISPGPTLTGMTQGVYSDPETRSRRESAIPLRRLGMPEDMANAIVFLCRPEASFITGVDLPVDGGMLTILMQASGSGSGHKPSK